MKDASISVNWFGVPCGCRCRHCLLRAGGRPSGVSYEDAEAVARRFVAWRDEAGRSDLLVDFVVGYPLDFPQVCDYVRFSRQLGVPGAGYLALNGMRMRTAGELLSFLADL